MKHVKTLKLNFKAYNSKSFLEGEFMKKLILGIFLFVFAPLMVNAADYKITDQLIKADIQNNGDLLIKELIVMDGSFNGYEKDLSYANSVLQDNLSSYDNNSLYNGRGLQLIDIKGKYVKNVSFDTFLDTGFELFQESLYANNGDKLKYTVKNKINGYNYRLYYKANKEKVAFLITYLVKDVVVLHNDVAELYWNFITPNDYDDIRNVQVKVSLPDNDLTDNFRIWLHGSLSGEIKKINNQEVLATYDYMEKEDLLDIRVTFDNNLITNKTNVKKDNNDALAKIIEVETKRADIANKLRQELKGKYDFVFYSTIIFYTSIVILGIIIYFKYGKSPKSGYYSKYNREFIDDYNVEVIDYLMNKKITPNAMSASIMNLVYKKNLSVEEIVNEKSKKKDYMFTLENLDNINDSEKMLIEFLFDRVGKGNLVNDKKTFTTIDLKKYADGTKTCNSFISSYTKWKNDILAKGKKETFYESFAFPKVLGIIVMIVSFMLFMYTISNEVDFIPAYFVIMVGIIFFFCGLLIDRKTKKGALHYDKWKAFKNFLNDFGTFDMKELPEIVLWERYLVYATIFGLADKVQKNMNVRINELDLSASSYDYYPSFVYINLGHSINNSVNQALSTAYSRQAANYANSHSSSSSGGGFGGGASFGGGFGGGGSSGHGF